jgi:hypothetical protein
MPLRTIPWTPSRNPCWQTYFSTNFHIGRRSRWIGARQPRPPPSPQDLLGVEACVQLQLLEVLLQVPVGNVQDLAGKQSRLLLHLYGLVEQFLIEPPPAPAEQAEDRLIPSTVAHRPSEVNIATVDPVSLDACGAGVRVEESDEAGAQRVGDPLVRIQRQDPAAGRLLHAAYCFWSPKPAMARWKTFGVYWRAISQVGFVLPESTMTISSANFIDSRQRRRFASSLSVMIATLSRSRGMRSSGHSTPAARSATGRGQAVAA